jgi:mono/diheme cytochrome c family protein
MAESGRRPMNPVSNVVALTLTVLAVASSLGMVGYLCYEGAVKGPSLGGGADPKGRKDDAGSREAFAAAYRVFMSPRCMNCHPSGDVPLQGDDNHLHAQNVKRGPDGKGLYALKCAACHQEANLPGDNMPPGSPKWQLPPIETRMVFQGKTAGELARQLKDPKQNGGKTLDDILKHVTEDKLVLAGWDPGDGRTKPPLSHAEFAAKMREWIEKGAAAPE